RASDTRELIFQDAIVPKENVLGPVNNGFRQFLHTLDGGRIGIAALALGLAEGALEECLTYTSTRTQFGRPIASLQGVHFALRSGLRHPRVDLPGRDRPEGERARPREQRVPAVPAHTRRRPDRHRGARAGAGGGRARGVLDLYVHAQTIRKAHRELTRRALRPQIGPPTPAS